MTTAFRRSALRFLVASLLLLLWLGIGGIGGPTFGKLSSVATNDQASFLPSNAESTRAQTEAAKFAVAAAIPAIVVVESPTNLTPAQMGSLARLTPSLAQAIKASGPQDVVGPLPATDHKAVMYLISLHGGKIPDQVSTLRSALAGNLPQGVNGYVTGPAGLAADLIGSFKGIDGILLYVALVAVFVILLLVYRSIVLPFLVLLTSMLALSAAGLVVYHAVTGGVIKLNGQSQGILSILAIGAATDYSLLIIARYREALEHYPSAWEAMLHALKNSFEPITASAATVIAGVLCLLFSELNSNKDLGPVAALGIAFSYLAAMTFLPALLVLLGRAAFWPFRPKLQPDSAERLAGLKTGIEDRRGLWRWVPNIISSHPRTIWLVCFVVLAGFALATPQFKASGVSQTDTILGKSDAVTGQKVLETHFAGDSTGSTATIVADAAKAREVSLAASSTAGVGAVTPYAQPARPGTMPQPKIVGGRTLLNATLQGSSDSTQTQTTIQDLRRHVKAIDPTSLVGGISAIQLDSNTAAANDIRTIIPIVLAVILVILMLLLRSILSPVLLIGSVILSFTATIGISALLFNYVFRFAGSDAAIPLFGFIFLVALGVDYNIFLMTRVREEAKRLGTRSGILRGLSVTGSVITSAGIVLAATFAALAVVPILFLVQIAFIVAFGVLLDTIVVRSLLIPALSYDIGKTIWWPSKLWRSGR